MSGIAGLIRTSPYEGVRNDLRLMVDSMRHEPDYLDTEYVDEALGMYCGSVTSHRGSPASVSVVNRSKDVVLMLHGETFLSDDWQKSIGRVGGETGVLSEPSVLEAYLRLGEQFVRLLNGWFCGVITDLRTRRIYLFNDRFGMGRLYCHEGRDEFVFASEAKSILRIRPACRRLEPQSLAEFFKFNCVTGEKTLFHGISLLPNASSWVFDGTAVPQKRRYFDFGEWEQQPGLSADEFYPRFSETISKVVPRYADGGVRNIAMSLTAGLDSRVIVAALRQPEDTLPCYTFGGRWGEVLDIRIARKIARVFRQPFHAITLGAEFFGRFPELAHRTVYISDGTHDALGAHDIYFNQIAKQIAPVRLTGKFGSEVVRIRRLVSPMRYEPGFLRQDVALRVQDLPAFDHLTRTEHPLTRVVSEEIPWHESGKLAVEQSQLVLRSPYMDNALVKLMYQAPAAVRSTSIIQERYVRERSVELSRVPTNMGIFATDSPALRKALYVVFRGLLKIEYVYLFATPHWLTRLDRYCEWLKPERLVSGRQKWEAYRVWIKTEFADFVRDLLLRPGPFAEFIEPKRLETMIARHLAGTHNYLWEINKALTLELICSTLLGRHAATGLSDA